MKLGTAVVTVFALAAIAAAQDPPSRVARVTLLEGQVSFQPASVDDWSAAAPNYPLTLGDHLYTDQNSRAELHIGPNAVRLSALTDFSFLNLDDQAIQIRLTAGSLHIRIRDLGEQDVWEIDTPDGAISLLRTGEYRIDTDPGRATMVTVRGGSAEVTAAGRSFVVKPRQTAYFTADGRPEQIQNQNPPDAFDQFARDRDQLQDSAPAPLYVSENLEGYEDLDRYGSWEPESEFGPVWRPRVSDDWAPYRDGRWLWREPWGWTWIDDAPWGFAPSHYGRWAFVGGRWGWCPGRAVIARPVYAPALVAFVGGGLGAGAGIGWFPLGPGDLYTPAYRASARYTQDLNRFSFRNGRGAYLNRNAPGAFTAISRDEFVGSRQVQRTGFHYSSEQFRGAPVSTFASGFTPERRSFLGQEPGRSVRPPDAIFRRQVIAKTPPPAAPVAFELRRQALEANQGRPLAPQQAEGFRGGRNAQDSAVRVTAPTNRGFGRNAENPEQRAAEPNRGVGRAPQGQPAPAETAPRPESGFGRQPQRQQAVPAPAETAPRPESGFGRQAQRQQPAPAPAAAPPSENRGFGRAERGEARPVPAERGRFEQKQDTKPRQEKAHEEKARPEKPKEERR